MPSFILELEVSYSGTLLKERKPGTKLKDLGIKHTLDYYQAHYNKLIFHL
nr:hypothetical protein [uncultured Blautia sp.]